MRWFCAVMLILIAMAQADLWVGERGMPAVWRLNDAIAAQRVENAAFKQRNERLAAEVTDLREGLEAVEERARHELGMIKKGETYYQLVR